MPGTFKKKSQYRWEPPKYSKKLTPEVVKKIEEASALRASDTEIAFYAGISRQTFYEWKKKVPGLADRIDDLKQKPFLIARSTIVKAIATDPNHAFKFLEKEKPDDYAARLNVNYNDQSKNNDLDPAVHDLRLEYMQKMRTLVKDYWDKKEKDENKNETNHENSTGETTGV